MLTLFSTDSVLTQADSSVTVTPFISLQLSTLPLTLIAQSMSNFSSTGCLLTKTDVNLTKFIIIIIIQPKPY